MPQNSSESGFRQIIWNKTPAVRIANDYWHAQSTALPGHLEVKITVL